MKKHISMLLLLAFAFCSIFAAFQPINAYAESPQIGTGKFHTEILTNDGSLWAWGYNGHGELGNGTTTNRSTPAKLSAISSVKSISSGRYHTLALKEDGTVWAWGYNEFGQLGNGENNSKSNPVQVSGLSSVKKVFNTNYNYSVALKEDGTVWAWGYNGYGQLGDGTTTNKNTPVKAVGLNSIIDIAPSINHCVALKEDGTVWAWGINANGELGDGTFANQAVPVQVPGLTSVKEIAVGRSFTLALKKDGTVWAWGYNGHGALGDGNTSNRSAPMQVLGIDSIISIVCSQYHAMALKQDGTVWAWGYNAYGQLGDGTNVNKSTPVQVVNLSNVTQIDCGEHDYDNGGYDHSAALKNDGTVWTWGYNGSGQLGNGTTSNSNKPVQVSDLNSVKEIHCQAVSMIALKDDGTLWTWGYNVDGLLGNGTTANSSKPVKVLLSPLYTPAGITLNAEPDSSQIKLTWSTISGAEKYTVKRSTTSGGPYSVIQDSVTNAVYSDAGVVRGTTYYYVVSTVNSKGETITSNEVSAALTGTQPELIVNAAESVKLGDTFTTEVVLNNGNNICAEDLKITYDANLFEYMGSEQIPGLKIYKEVKQGVGTLRFIIASQGKQNAINGQKALVKLKFKAIKPGKGLVDVVKGRIADNGTIEMDILPKNCGKKSITVLGTLDVNRSGQFTLIDLAIDAWYLGDKAVDTDTSKYDADVVTDGIIDDLDLSAIVQKVLDNAEYPSNN